MGLPTTLEKCPRRRSEGDCQNEVKFKRETSVSLFDKWWDAANSKDKNKMAELYPNMGQPDRFNNL